MSNKIFFFLQSVLRYLPFKLGIYLRRVIYRPFFKKLGKNVRIFDSVVIKYPNDIELGDHTTINQFCYVVGKGSLKIGCNVMIGAGTKIATSSHNYEDTATPMSEQGISTAPISIGNDVWFGFNSVVLGGSTVGDSCIVAANAVVNSVSFDAYSIIGGVPAKLIRKRK